MTAVEKLAAEIIGIVLDNVEPVVIQAILDEGKIDTDQLLTLSKGVYYQIEEKVSFAIHTWLFEALREAVTRDIDSGIIVREISADEERIMSKALHSRKLIERGIGAGG